MSVLYVVPHFELHRWRKEILPKKGAGAAVSVKSLASEILSEGLAVYKEDRVLEEIAVWRGIWENGEDLHFFAPISHFPGFVRELKGLFLEIDSGSAVLENIPERGRAELELLHGAYARILNQHGVLDMPGQLKKALELCKNKRFRPAVSRLQLQGLADLSPLESQFLSSYAQERTMETVYARAAAPVIEVIKSDDPYVEVEQIGAAIRRQVEEGMPLNRIVLAFPQPSEYLPILSSVFALQNIPWRAPAVNLSNTALGKSILVLISSELEDWRKHHLQLLTAPGWGFPFALTSAERRLLRLAPPLKGLSAWREYLGKLPGWRPLLEFLQQSTLQLAPSGSISSYGTWLEGLLLQLEPDKWAEPEADLEAWAEYTKAWNGLLDAAKSLKQHPWPCSAAQFFQLLSSLLDNYRVRGLRSLAQELQVFSTEQLGAYAYDQLYVGGLVEGRFPPRPQLHWLTKAVSSTQGAELYGRLVDSAAQVYLYYPETDREGKLNLPSTLLPRQERKEAEEAAPPARAHRPSLFLDRGVLQDQQALQALKEKILQNGLSVSELNEYAQCPYKFFCSNVLHLEPFEEETLQIGPREQGIILHELLDSFWKPHLQGPLPPLENALAELEGLLRNIYKDQGENPPAALVRTMRMFLRKDLELVRGGFRPRYLERKFRGLAVATPWGAVEINGRIDRIDLNESGDYVLYDYKSGRAPTGKAMAAGEDIQIAAYLLAAKDILPQGKNVGAAYYLIGGAKRAGIFHADFHRQLGIRKSLNCLGDQEFADQIGFFEKTLQEFLGGVFAGEFPIEPVDSRICGYCPYRSICRKEVGG